MYFCKIWATIIDKETCFFSILINVKLNGRKIVIINRGSRPEVFCKKGVLKNLATGLQLYEKETLTQMFFCEFCEIFKIAFFYRAPLMAAYELTKKLI